MHFETIELTSITIINRKDGCGERLKDVEVRAGMSPGLDNDVVGTFTGPGTTGGVHTIRFNRKVKASYIVIQIKGTGILQVNGIRFNEAPIRDREG